MDNQRFKSKLKLVESGIKMHFQHLAVLWALNLCLLMIMLCRGRGLSWFLTTRPPRDDDSKQRPDCMVMVVMMVMVMMI